MKMAPVPLLSFGQKARFPVKIIAKNDGQIAQKALLSLLSLENISTI
jgi:hypothetical protein